MTRKDLRTVDRYFLNPSLPGFANGRAVRLVDLSIKGARLESFERYQPGEEVFLAIIVNGDEITVPGTVLWCELDSLPVDSIHDRYLSGLCFAHSMPAFRDLLEDFCSRDLAVRIRDFRDFDRYRVTAPLTGSFGDHAPVSILDLSIRGARIVSRRSIGVGEGAHLRFRVDDETGPIDVQGKVQWTTPVVAGGEQAGLMINGGEDVLRLAIHRLCVRGEARIDIDSLRRKFDQLRANTLRQSVAG